MRNGKILVVNNEVKMRKILERFVHKRGFNVKSVDSGSKAIEVLNNDKFDLVLCDYFMMVKLIKRLGKSTKIGLLTDYDDLIRNKEMEVEFVIKKPFDLIKLGKYINEVTNCETEDG